MVIHKQDSSTENIQDDSEVNKEKLENIQQTTLSSQCTEHGSRNFVSLCKNYISKRTECETALQHFIHHGQKGNHL